MAYHFFVGYARIDCDRSEELYGDEKKTHLKAYGDLMYLLNERKALVEQYFCVPITEESFRKLCNDLYFEGHKESCDACLDEVDTYDINNIRVHLPYSLGCNFSDEAIKILYNCLVSEAVFKNITEEKVKAFFDGNLSSDIKCFKATRLGYILYQLSDAGVITRQYQKAIGNCGYVILPTSDEPMTAENLKQSVRRAKVYETKNLIYWKYTINRKLNELFKLMDIDVILP